MRLIDSFLTEIWQIFSQNQVQNIAKNVHEIWQSVSLYISLLGINQQGKVIKMSEWG